MTSVKLTKIPASRIMEIARELKNEGIEFTFSYTPSKWDIDTGEIPNFTIFNFTREKDATYFILKWKII